MDNTLDSRLARLVEMGQQRISSGKHAEAVEAFNMALVIAPQSSRILHMLGNAYFGLGNLEESIECYSSAMCGVGFDPEIANHLAQAHFRLKEFGKAASICETVLAYDDTNITALTTMGNIASRLGDTDKSAGYYQRAVSQSVQTPYQLYELCHAYDCLTLFYRETGQAWPAFKTMLLGIEAKARAFVLRSALSLFSFKDTKEGF